MNDCNHRCCEPKTHNEIIQDIIDRWDWNFRFEFIRELVGYRDERKDTTFFHVLAGKIPEKTGKKFCPHCDGYYSDISCQNFESYVENTIQRDVIEPFTIATCPECHTEIEDRRPIEFISESPAFYPEDKAPDPSESVHMETERKTQYQPCGCIFEFGEEMIRADLEKDAIRKEVIDGYLAGQYQGPVFNYEAE